MGVIFFLSLFLMAVRIRAQVLRDTENNPVTTFGRYFLIDKVAWEERGQRLEASHAPQTFAHACPRVAVVPDQERSSYYRVPVSLSPHKGNFNNFVFQDSSMTIKYEIRIWPCPEENPPVWTVGHETPIQDFDIGFGGTPKNTLTTFKIHSHGGGYIITHYNPQTRRTDTISLLNAPELGYNRLVVASNDRPFIFVLQNAEPAFKKSSLAIS